MIRSSAPARRFATVAVIVSLVAAVPGFAELDPAGLAGTVVFAEASESDAWSIVLIDASGREADRAPLEADGRYRIDAVPPGTYLLALGDEEGRYAPVLDAPLVLAPATVERRDIRVVAQDGDEDPMAEEAARYSRLRIWWVGLSKGKKAATILGIVGGAGLGWALLDDDDDPVSPVDPGR